MIFAFGVTSLGGGYALSVFLLMEGGLFYGLCRWAGLLPTPGDRSRRGDLNG